MMKYSILLGGAKTWLARWWSKYKENTSTLVLEVRTATVKHVEVTEDSLVVDLADGRTTSVPLAWYPRLLHAVPEERGNWRLIGEGEGIHWPDLDEDVSVENILFGRPSQESQESFRRWLEARPE
jgi:hypothetical protein